MTLFGNKPSCFSYVNDHVHGLVSMRIPTLRAEATFSRYELACEK